jgi:histone-lysine N-methyltransferase SETMAR
MFLNFDQRQIANIVTGVETWVYYFEPARKMGNKISLTKHGKRPVVAKRNMSTKKVL